MDESINDSLIFYPINELDLVDDDSFNSLVTKSEPVLIRNCPFGDCMTKWNLEYLSNVIGEKEIVFHQSCNKELEFTQRNFSYRRGKFREFSKLILEDSNSHYLRSVNSESKTRKAAHIPSDFPKLDKDLVPPPFIPYGHDNNLYHSSVLRIASSDVQIWTHFDVHDNVLCQTHGTKRVILIAPDDTKFLYVTRDKSKINCFDDQVKCLEQYPLVRRAKLYSCHLKPGEVLFIPAFWWHNIRTVEPCEFGSSKGSYSIGFNIFWRNRILHDESLYSAGDIYGNKDLKPFAQALTDLDQAEQHLRKLPMKYRCLHKTMLHQYFKSIFAIEDD